MTTTFPFSSTVKPTKKPTHHSHKTNPIYAALKAHEQAHLLVITHFIHVHYSFLLLSPHDLLHPVEDSILQKSGKVYDSLTARILTRVSEDDYLGSLRSAIDDLASTGKFRDACVNIVNGSINNNSIHPSARPMSVYDSKGMKYVWVRGRSGVSTRFVAGEKVLQEPLVYAEYLRKRGGRKDVFVSGWIASRVESAERKAGVVKQEFLKEEERRKIREEIERNRKKEKERRMERLCNNLGVMVTGGRRRGEVTYEESDDDGEAETGDEEFMISEELLDSGSGYDDDDEDEEEDEEEEEEGEDMVVGRVRVKVSERAKRAARRAERIVGRGKRLRSGRIRDELVDEGVSRRSKRLRGINA